MIIGMPMALDGLPDASGAGCVFDRDVGQRQRLLGTDRHSLTDFGKSQVRSIHPMLIPELSSAITTSAE